MRNPPPIPIFKKKKKIWLNAKWFILLGFLAVIFLAGFAAYLTQKSKQPYTTSKTELEFIVGEDRLLVPSNLVRFSAATSRSDAQSLKLAMVWPSGDGYSEENAVKFADTSDNSKIIFMEITKRQLRLDMTGRLQSVYSALFEGPPQNGPAGLKMQNLRKNSGYDGEQLAIYIDNSIAWVARCQQGQTGLRATCMRDLHVGTNASLTYRFPVKLLQYWREIEELVVNRIEQAMEPL